METLPWAFAEGGGARELDSIHSLYSCDLNVNGDFDGLNTCERGFHVSRIIEILHAMKQSREYGICTPVIISSFTS